MNSDSQNHYDPLEKLLAAEPTEDVVPGTLLPETLHKANRTVGIKDMFGLMLVNLWVVLAKIMVPVFTANHKKQKNKTIERGE